MACLDLPMEFLFEFGMFFWLGRKHIGRFRKLVSLVCP